MNEIEVPLETSQESIHHAALHASDSDKRFMNMGAIIAALLAVAAAVSALFAGHMANEALLEQIQASNKWAYYQAKGIKASIAEMKASENGDKVAKYKEQQEEISKEAQEKERESQHHLLRHESLAAAVTFFQIAIAITAIAVLTRKRSFFAGSIGLGFLGLIWIVKGFL